MIRQKLLSGIVLSGLLVSQFSFAGAVYADDATPSPSPSAAVESPSPSVTPSATPAATPTPTPDPSPSVSPDPSASPSPSASSSPSPSVSPSPSKSPEPKVGANPAQIGPGECTGVVPKWVFDTQQQVWVAADQGSFSCDLKSGYWLSPKYYYDKNSGWYQIMPASTPKSDDLLTAPNVIHTALGDLVVGSKDYQIADALGLLNPTSGIVIGTTGPSSNNQSTINNTNQSWFDLTNLVNVINVLQSNATSGNVAADSNTQVGSAVTGAASVIANLVNLLASAWSWSNGNLSFFMQNIGNALHPGSTSGDITLNPTQNVTGGGGQLGGSATTNNTGPDSNNIAGVNNSSTLDVNAKSTGNILNNVDLNAQSGNASATNNTLAGNVASGNATAEVNIINLINSMIASGNSFFGILNIFGNYSGDILFPSGFLNGLVSSGSGTSGSSTAALNGTGPNSTNQASVNNNAQSTLSNTSFNGVANNIQTSAASGAVNADANTTAGNLQSGGANTTQGLFNLSNTSIFGDNAVLVIVNVLGHWVGKIMSIPGGSTESALLTGGATVGSNGTGPDSNNQTSVNNTSKANVKNESVGTITNNVNVNAQSGNANASKNTQVGDVSTGDARAASSVANIFNTVLNVKHWFGVLVINVFGDWLGDVNHDSAAGNATQTTSTAQHQTAGQTATSTGSPKVNGAATSRNSGGASGGSVEGAAGTTVTSDDGAKVLTAAAQQPSSAQTKAIAQGRGMSVLFMLSAIVMLIAGALATIERKLRRR